MDEIDGLNLRLGQYKSMIAEVQRRTAGGVSYDERLEHIEAQLSVIIRLLTTGSNKKEAEA